MNLYPSKEAAIQAVFEEIKTKAFTGVLNCLPRTFEVEDLSDPDHIHVKVFELVLYSGRSKHRGNGPRKMLIGKANAWECDGGWTVEILTVFDSYRYTDEPYVLEPTVRSAGR